MPKALPYTRQTERLEMRESDLESGLRTMELLVSALPLQENWPGRGPNSSDVIN
jgi:hypothetical protein